MFGEHTNFTLVFEINSQNKTGYWKCDSPYLLTTVL